ncbi:MAG: hypothetical protein GQ564_10755 [Bacteroidales bacterium]|nr:hypothetical protein [Bacteroidales bacterium]
MRKERTEKEFYQDEIGSGIYAELTQWVASAFSFPILSNKKKVDFEDCEFNGTFSLDRNVQCITIWDCEFNKKTEIDLSIRRFEEELQIAGCTIKGDISFYHSKFEKEALFSNTIFEGNVNFINTVFNEECNFESAIFKGAVKFTNANFKSVANFTNVTFEKPVSFYYTDFQNNALFSSSNFKENVLFTYSNINDLLVFNQTRFSKGLDLSQAIIKSNINTFKVNIKDFESIDTKSDYEEYIKDLIHSFEIPNNNKQETFRILKNHSLNQNNKIQAQEFLRLEILGYTDNLIEHTMLYRWIFNIENFLKRIFLKKSNPNRKELKYKSARLIKLSNYNIQDLISNVLNGISNGHGTKWFKAVLFTFFIATIIYFVSTEYLIDSAFEKLPTSKKISCFFTFIQPTHKSNFLDNYNPTSFFYFIDFLGRIFISYGIYQTIAAFRKNTKK